MIILENLEFSNMYSYGPNNILDLNKDPITQLNAPNGNGKTSLSLIIQELLYSKNVKGIKKDDILNRYLKTSDWQGTVTFSDLDSKKKYRVKVTRTKTGAKVKLTENDVDISDHKIPDTYKKIKDILGMDFEIFSQLTYQSSSDLLEFLKATDTSRKTFLINLFNIQKYINIGEIWKLKINETDKDIILKQGELNAVEGFLTTAKIQDKLEPVIVPEIDENLVGQKALLNKEIEEHQAFCAKIDKNNLYTQEQRALKFDMGLQKPEHIEYQNLTRDKFEVAGNIASKVSRISDIRGLLKKLNLADKCYACGQQLDNSQALNIKNQLEKEQKELESEIEAQRHIIQDLNQKIGKYQEKEQLYLENKKKIERFEQLSQLIDLTLPDIYPDIVEKQQTLKQIDLLLTNQKNNRSVALKHNEQITTFNTKIDALIEQKREFLAKQVFLKEDLEKLKLISSRRTILRKAFSPTGIVAFKLENLTKELEESINNYLSELSDGQFQVIFRLVGEKLNVIIVNNGIESALETLSGGEYSRVQTAILLAIRNILSKIGGNSINLLFLDEIDGVLDAVGKEKLIDVLREEQNLNVFLISHSFTHPLISKIEIKKDNNISKIVA